MNTKLLLIIGFSYLYAIIEVWMNVKQRRKSLVKHRGDQGSLRLLYMLITMGYVLSFSSGATKFGRIYAWDTFFAVGIVFVVTGLAIRILSIMTLRQYFTYSVATLENHALVDTGIYKYIRHPGYVGQIIIFTGISVSLSNWLSILLMLIPVLTGYLYRIKVEERFMADLFGEKYLDYARRTKKLIPMIY